MASGSSAPPTNDVRIAMQPLQRPQQQRIRLAEVAPVAVLDASKPPVGRKERQHQYYLANRERIREQRLLKKRLLTLKATFGEGSEEVVEEEARQAALLHHSDPTVAEIASFALSSMDEHPDAILQPPPAAAVPVNKGQAPDTNSYFYRKARDFNADVIYAREQMELKLARMAETRKKDAAVVAVAVAASAAKKSKDVKGR